MAEQADAMVSNTIVRKGMRVRIPLRARRCRGRRTWLRRRRRAFRAKCHQLRLFVICTVRSGKGQGAAPRCRPCYLGANYRAVVRGEH